jgi:hypothetical protein
MDSHEMRKNKWMGVTAFIFGVSIVFLISSRPPVKKAKIEGHVYRACQSGRMTG